MKNSEELKKEIVLKIKENSYTVKFPDTGTLVDLEERKARIPFPNSNSSSSLWAYNLTIAIETFRMLVPKLQEDLNVKDFYKLELLESKELVVVYLRVFKPWFEKWIEIITDIFEGDEKGSKNA